MSSRNWFSASTGWWRVSFSVGPRCARTTLCAARRPCADGGVVLQVIWPSFEINLFTDVSVWTSSPLSGQSSSLLLDESEEETSQTSNASSSSPDVWSCNRAYCRLNQTLTVTNCVRFYRWPFVPIVFSGDPTWSGQTTHYFYILRHASVNGIYKVHNNYIVTASRNSKTDQYSITKVRTQCEILSLAVCADRLLGWSDMIWTNNTTKFILTHLWRGWSFTFCGTPL